MSIYFCYFSAPTWLPWKIDLFSRLCCYPGLPKVGLWIYCCRFSFLPGAGHYVMSVLMWANAPNITHSETSGSVMHLLECLHYSLNTRWCCRVTGHEHHWHLFEGLLLVRQYFNQWWMNQWSFGALRDFAAFIFKHYNSQQCGVSS